MIEAKKQFYRAFEERYRGSRENIKEKLKIYLPFIKPLHQKYPKGIVIDIGCGRGEFVELMQDEQINAKGIDLDEGMLEAGLSLGLNMERGDGLSFLRTMKDKSAIAVTAFHVVEHISFDELQDMVSESLRVLKPGGLLILETPNPENIRVSCESFYLDPTHLRPLPSDLLTFIAEYNGYFRNRILRLQESELLSAQKYANIGQIIEGVSPDYAIIAQKEAEPEIIALIDIPFSAEYGLSLSSLVEKFERRMLRFEELVDKMLETADKAAEYTWKAEIQVTEAQRGAKQAEESAEKIWQHYQTLVNSRSWRVTKPLRYTTDILRRIKSDIKRIIRATIRSSKQTINRYPKIKMKLLKILDHFPGMKQKLKSLAMPQDLHPQTSHDINIDPPKPSFPDTGTILNDLEKNIKKQSDQS